MTTPRLSILLPVYNGARFLDEQIASVLAQTFGNFELLIQDDASTDASAEIARSHAASDPRIVFAASRTNAGQRATLAELLSRAKSQAIAFCDQDDVWDAPKLERLMVRLPDRGLAYGSSPLIDETGARSNTTLFDHVGAPFQGRDVVDLLRGNTVSAHAMVVDRWCLPAAAFAHGSVFDWTVALVAAANGGVAYVPDAVTFHRQHGENFNNRLHVAPARFLSNGSERMVQWARHFEALEECVQSEPDAAAAYQDFAARLLDWRPTARACLRNNDLIASGERALAHLSGSDLARNAALKTLGKMARGDLHPRAITRNLRVAARRAIERVTAAPRIA